MTRRNKPMDAMRLAAKLMLLCTLAGCGDGARSPDIETPEPEPAPEPQLRCAPDARDTAVAARSVGEINRCIRNPRTPA